MDVKLAMLADYASPGAAGKLNVMGIFGAIYAPSFPVVHEQMSLVLRFACNSAEFGIEKDLQIVLVDADGNHMVKLNGHMHVPEQDGPDAEFDQILNIRDLVFPAAGDYAFIVTIQGDTKQRVPLKLIQIGEQKKNGKGRDAKKRK